MALQYWVMQIWQKFWQNIPADFLYFGQYGFGLCGETIFATKKGGGVLWNNVMNVSDVLWITANITTTIKIIAHWKPYR